MIKKGSFRDKTEGMMKGGTLDKKGKKQNEKGIEKGKKKKKDLFLFL